MTPENRDSVPDAASGPAETLLALPELAKAVETDEFKEFLDHLPIAIAVSRITDNRSWIVYANTAFETLVDCPLGVLEGQTWSFLSEFVHEDDSNLSLDKLVLVGDDFLGTFIRRAAGVREILAQAYSTLIENDVCNKTYRIVVLVDVTDQERAKREAFEREIQDRDTRLREIQHRVRNNLQLLVALIRLTARRAERGEPVDLDRLGGRIEALSQLYDAMDASSQEVDLGHYLGQIATAAVRAQAVDGIKLDLKVNFCPVSVNIAMPTGLIVNEVLTNAFKYAFEGREKGTITLECLRNDDDCYRIVVGDDGVGLPVGIAWPPVGKLSATILRTLRQNSGADVKVESSPGQGMRVIITFVHKASVHKLS